MTDKTPVDLDHLDALHKDATPAPWYIVPAAQSGRSCEHIVGNVQWEGETLQAEIPQDEQDDALIVALRNAYPAMAQELRRLRARVAELEGDKKGRWVIFDKDDRQYRFRDRVSWHASPGRCQHPWRSEEAATAVCHGYPVINLDTFAELLDATPQPAPTP